MPTRGASITATSDYGSDLDIDVRSIASLSDYGSEFDPDDIDLSAAVGEEKSVYSSIEFKQGERNSIIDHEDTPMAVFVRAGLYTAKRRTAGNRQAARAVQSSPVRETMEFEYLSRPRQVWSVPREEPPEVPSKSINTFSSASSESIPVADQPITPAEHDIRSPIERFRMKPKKPLSVTDLVSPAWCELQYLYALSKFGRKPRTKAMRTGSRIHQTLEEQVHTIVPVQVKSKEDRFGLRIWNMIRGLRCLRETGLTRELEVWGVIQGEVVNGVIDELSYTCPDREFEEQLELSKAEEAGGTLPLGQMKIEQAFYNAAYDDQNDSGWLGSLEADRQVYIVDVKTRSVRSPPKGASLRPTWMQLMLYRRLLESLSLNTVDAEAIFERYNLCSLEPFTEVFISEIRGLGDASEDSDDDYNGSGANSQANEVLQHPNLLSLWSLMIMELQHTLPSASISSILRAEFRFAKTGDVIGNELAVYDGIVIESYISDVMKLWKGKREAKGVDIEDAFKCRMCDFVDQCAWRKTKIEEATEKHRRRNKARGKDKV